MLTFKQQLLTVMVFRMAASQAHRHEVMNGSTAANGMTISLKWGYRLYLRLAVNLLFMLIFLSSHWDYLNFVGDKETCYEFEFLFAILADD